MGECTDKLTGKVSYRVGVFIGKEKFRAGSLNGDAGADATADATAAATADSTDSKKTWIFKSFSRIIQGITGSLNHFSRITQKKENLTN